MVSIDQERTDTKHPTKAANNRGTVKGKRVAHGADLKHRRSIKAEYIR